MAGQTMPMADDADGIGLPAGATKTLTYTFNQAGTLITPATRRATTRRG
jgi:hypothetical protein